MYIYIFQEEDESGNPIQALPIIGESPVGTSTEENVSSRPIGPFLPLPHNLILTPELTTFACTAISAQNITRQSNASLTPSSSIAPTMSANQASVSTTSASVVMETSDAVTSSSSVETPVTPSSSIGLNVNAIQMIGGQKDSPGDFRSPKRRRIGSSEKSVSGDQEEEGNVRQNASFFLGIFTIKVCVKYTFIMQLLLDVWSIMLHPCLSVILVFVCPVLGFHSIT